MIRAADASQQPIRFATLIKVRHAVFTRNNVSEQLFCVNDFVLYLAHCRQTPRQLLAPWLSKKRKRIAGGLVGIVVSVSAEALRSGQDVALFEANGVELLPQHAKAQTFYASSNVLLSLLFMHSRPGTVLYRLVTERLLTHAAVETQLSVSGEDLTALECEKTTYRRAKRIATTEKDSQPNEATSMRRKSFLLFFPQIFFFACFCLFLPNEIRCLFLSLSKSCLPFVKLKICLIILI